MKQFIQFTVLALAAIYCIVAFILTISQSPEGEITIFNFIGLGMIAAAIVTHNLFRDSQTASSDQ